MIIRRRPLIAATLSFALATAGCGPAHHPGGGFQRSVTVPNSPPRSIDGMGTAARFGRPAGLAFDSKGNLYVADTLDEVIRRVTPSGLVSTFAGAAGQAGHADGAGSSARFTAPNGIAIDSHDNLYVTDSYNETIRKISPSGEVSTFAGTDGHAGITDGVGTAAMFDFPQGIAIDRAGALYVVAESAVRKISPDARVTTLAGHSKPFDPSDINGYVDGSGSSARFHDPEGIAVDPKGNLFVADNANFVIRKISPAGVVSTVAGIPGQQGAANGSGLQAMFFLPDGIAVDTSSNLYVSDCNTGLIREISLAGTVTTSAAAAGAGCARGIAIDAAGNIYVSIGGASRDGQGDGAILKITPGGSRLVFAGMAPTFLEKNN